MPKPAAVSEQGDRMTPGSNSLHKSPDKPGGAWVTAYCHALEPEPSTGPQDTRDAPALSSAPPFIFHGLGTLQQLFTWLEKKERARRVSFFAALVN